jgi:hypothetical protein
MRTQYLLPCSCGEKVAVETSQAGDRARCRCGAELDVPSMRGLRELETATPEEPSTPSRAESEWGLRQGLILTGVLLIVFSLPPAGFLYSVLPERPVFDMRANIEANQQNIDEMNVVETWMVWREDMLGRGLRQYPNAVVEAYEARRGAILPWIFLSLGVAALGLIVAVAGAFVKPPATISHKPEAPARENR